VKNENLRRISDLASFVFDTLKLNKNCLHFNFQEFEISGDGQEHISLEAVDEEMFEGLTGLPLPEEAFRIRLRAQIQAYTRSIH
jgi:hypothetical protein